MDLKAIRQRTTDLFNIDHCIKNVDNELVSLIAQNEGVEQQEVKFTIIPFDGMPECPENATKDYQVKEPDCEWQYSINTRHLILDKISKLPPVSLRALRFAKPLSIQVLDDLDLENCKGRLEGYRKGITEKEEHLEQSSKLLLSLQTSLNGEITKIQDLEAELGSYLNEEPVQRKNLTITKFWNDSLTAFSKQIPFEISDTLQITNFNLITWPSTTVSWERQDDHNLKGAVSSTWFRGCFLNLTTYTSRRLHYKARIESLESEKKKN